MPKVVKLADKLTAAEFTDYLVQHAQESYYVPDQALMRAPLTRGFKRVLDGFDNNGCAVALIVDHLLVAGWPSDAQGITESMLTVGVFDYAMRDMGGSQQHWIYLYYRRFRETADERDFFTYYLGQLEDCRTAPLGTQPSDYPDTTWEMRRVQAHDRLGLAVQTIKGRMDERGSLVEWISFPPPFQDEAARAFLANPGRSTLLPSKERD